jgi:ribosomal protein S27AE
LDQRRADQGKDEGEQVTKVCKGCGESKPLEEFHKTTRTLDGRIARCKICKAKYNNPEKKREYDLVYRAVNRERRLEGYRKYNEENAESIKAQRTSAHGRMVHRLSEVRRRARKAELPHEPYTVEQIVERDGDRCWMCGKQSPEYQIEHLIALATKQPELTKWGIDHHPGDVLANVALACPSCNRRKWASVLPCALARYLRNVLGSTPTEGTQMMNEDDTELPEWMRNKPVCERCGETLYGGSHYHCGRCDSKDVTSMMGHHYWNIGSQSYEYRCHEVGGKVNEG